MLTYKHETRLKIHKTIMRQLHFTDRSVGLHPPNTSRPSTLWRCVCSNVRLGWPDWTRSGTRRCRKYWEWPQSQRRWKKRIFTGMAMSFTVEKDQVQDNHFALAPMDGDHMLDQRKDEWTKSKKIWSQHCPWWHPRPEEVESDMPKSGPCNSVGRKLGSVVYCIASLVSVRHLLGHLLWWTGKCV